MISKAKKDRRFRYYIVAAIFIVASVFQVLSPSSASAASKVEDFSLENQIKTYKLYNSVAVCFDINQNRSLSASQAASWQWFAPSGNATDSGSIVSGGNGNGDVNCNDQIKIAASLWGITDPVAFLKKAGWKATTTSDYDDCKRLNPIDEFGSCNIASTTKKTVLTAPAKNWGSGFKTAARAQLDGYGGTYRSYFAYQDAMETLLGTCGGTITTGDPNETQKASGAATVYVVGSDGKTSQDFVLTSKLKDTVKYGAADGVFGLTSSNYDGKDTRCADIVKYLGTKANAQKFYSNLPASMRDAYSGAMVSLNALNASDGKKDDAPKSDCDPSMGLGWLLCPAINFLAGIGDQAKGFIDNAMTVNTFEMFATSTQSGGNTSAYTTWKNMRNIANVIFIIAFLFMIYSQLSGFGMTNYALKKMLPRLIVAAILINASFYITVAGVEISNVVGHGIDSMLSSVSGCGSADVNDTCIRVYGSDGHPLGDLTRESPATTFGQIAGTALTLGLAAAGLYFFLPTVIAVIIYVAFVAMAAAILLGIRQALIILLVIVSPIAFAAYLLPNTEGIFKKWWGLFKAMLFIFPIFALLYGAGKIAAAVLQSLPDPTMQVFGCIALFAGLLALPKLLEGALAVGGIASIVSKFQGKATGAATNKAKQAYDNSNFGNFRKYRKNKADLRNQIIRSGQYKGSNKNPLNWIRNARSEAAGATLPLYGSGYQADVQQRGAELQDKLWEQKVGNQQKYMSIKGMGSDELFDIVENKDGKSTEESRAAAAGMIMKNGSMSEIQSLFDKTQPISEKDDAAIVSIRKQMMHDMNRTPFGLGSLDQSNLRRGIAPTMTVKNPVTGEDEIVPKNYDNAIGARAENKMSDAAWNNLDPDDKIKLRDLAIDKKLSDKALESLVNASYTAENNPNISVTVETREWGEEIRKEAAKRGISVTYSGGTSNATPATPQTGGPHLRGETTRDNGFIIPRDGDR